MVDSHAGLTDLFVSQARREVERQPRASVREQLKQAQEKMEKKSPVQAVHQKEGAGAVSQPRRKRGVQLNFRVSEEELAAIESKMEPSLASSTGKPICAKWRWMDTPSGWTCRN